MSEHVFSRALSFMKGYLSRPKYPHNFNNIKIISVRKHNLQLLSCSNTIIHVKSDSHEGYFCECRKHLPIQEYITSLINDYFSCFSESSRESEVDKQLILDSIKHPEDFLKFSGIGKERPHTDSPLYRYLYSDNGYEIGLNLSLSSSEQKCRIRHFVERYAWPQLSAYYANLDTPKGKYHSRSTSKALATESLAHLIGLESTIPHSEYVFLCVVDAGNLVMFGTFMEKANGICPLDIPAEMRKSMITPNFQCSLVNMNLLDVICHELDHSPNNYNVVTDAYGRAINVSIYDNNGVGTFSLSPSISYTTYKMCSPILREDGTVNRPCLDNSVVQKLFSVTQNDITKAMAPFYGKPTIICTWLRIVRLKYAIKKSVAKKPDLLLDRNSFTEETMKAELSGSYGKTYLLSFLHDCLQRAHYR